MEATRPANRLANERSPYLLQHSHNPVDWWPWGDEAFDLARSTGRPVFLSVGYSACHWCHVMERESFEDAATAAFLNEHFVCIKVDREERPDIDQVYQLAHQVLTQRGGGWPLSMFLTPDRKPFFGGTYFPDARRHGMPSFREVLGALLEAWKDRREDVTAQAGEITDYVANLTSAGSVKEVQAPDTSVLPDAVRTVLSKRDTEWGGFGRAPKFPNTMTLDLLAIAAVTQEEALARVAREHLALTLDRMARGGMHDHLGGGFARYSTDARWLVPHFEKMLYDNGQLARIYLDGWRTLGDERLRDVVEDVFGYLLREMLSADGCFYSAQDADSEGEEGRFFVWTPESVAKVIGSEDARAVCAWYDVTEIGNFEHGNSVLWTPRAAAEVAVSLDISPTELAAVIARSHGPLFAARDARPHPALDDKCLASWNALVIGALADAGATLGQPTWIAAAQRALTTWRTVGFRDGRLRHAIKAGEAYGVGYLDDYAGLACAALDVYEATLEGGALAFARALGEAVIALFFDEAAGEFCYTPADGEVVLVRARDPHDHAYPGGVGLALDALLRLDALTGAHSYGDTAERALGVLMPMIKDNAMGVATVLRAADRVARGAIEIVVAGDPSRADTQALLGAARSVYVPHRTLAVATDASDAERRGIDATLYEGRAPAADGTPRVFVCRSNTCELPVSTPAELIATLKHAVRA